MTTAAAHTEAKILAIVHEQGRILLEQLPSYLPGSTWNQVFLGVDALSRQGAIRLRRRGSDYEVWTPAPLPEWFVESSTAILINPAILTHSR
jgi:hypothetical protein